MSSQQVEFQWKREDRASQIFKAFRDFHLDNPLIWDLFKRFSKAAIQSGRKHYSANAIFERIRWHIEIETSGDLKLNNNFRAYYARLFHLAYPQHGDFFRNRRLTSQDDEAHPQDKQVFDAGPPVGEGGLEAELLKLL